MNPTKKEKDAIRAKYKAIRAELPPVKKAELDRMIYNYAVNMASFRYADTLLLYAETDGEISVSDIANEALRLGKKIAFPKCDKDTHTMTYHYVTSLDELEPLAYGIREPKADAPLYDPNTDKSTALCFVPGLVYDKSGYRVGYGKGFYDRYLTSFKGCSIGVVYEDFILPSVPRGRFDVSVNILLTEKGVKITDEA